MSFILDALKKSESERQQQSAAEFATIPSGDGGAGAPRWLWVVVLLLAVNVAVLAGLLMRDESPRAVPASIDLSPQTGTVEPGVPFEDRVAEARQRQPVAVEQEPAPPATTSPDSTPVPMQSPTAPPASAFTPAQLPTANALRANGTLQLADLHLDIHVYSEVPTDRFVFINMVKHRENSQLAEGPVIREITPEGVILDYRGTVFILPRE